MNLPKDRPPSVRCPIILLASVVVAGALAILLWRHPQGTPPTSVRRGDAVMSLLTGGSAAGGTNSPASNAVAPVTSPQSIASSTPPIPSPVTDGKDTNSIRRWAHNELEVERMLKENEKIFRRQLVVLKEPVAFVVERNRLTGERIQQLTLPGLDGQEILFEVKRADLDPSGRRGTFYGNVAGRLDSMVTLAFKNNVQAFTILSPADNLYLDVEPHDPGDVIVKSIDLEKYGAGLCGVK